MFSGLKVKVGFVLLLILLLPHCTACLHLPAFPFVQPVVGTDVCNYHFSHWQTDTYMLLYVLLGGQFNIQTKTKKQAKTTALDMFGSLAFFSRQVKLN